jgi:Leucine Rich repeat
MELLPTCISIYILSYLGQKDALKLRLLHKAQYLFNLAKLAIKFTIRPLAPIDIFKGAKMVKIHARVFKSRRIKKISDVERLSIYKNNNLNGLDIAHLKSLWALKIDRCNFTDSDMAILFDSGIRLKKISIVKCDISDDGLQLATKMPLMYITLTLLDLITDKGISYFQNMALSKFKIYYCKNVTDNGIQYLSRAAIIHIYSHNMSYETISGLTGAQSITLRWSNNINCQSLGKLGRLKALNIKWFTLTNQSGLVFLRNITILDLSDTNISDDGLKALYETDRHECGPVCKRRIQEINLSNCKDISDNGMTYLCGIDQLNLRDTRITNNGIMALFANHAHNWPEMNSLSLNSVYDITNEALKYIKVYGELSLAYNNNITDEGLAQLRVPYSLNLYGCPNITPTGLHHILKATSIVELTISGNILNSSSIFKKLYPNVDID